MYRIMPLLALLLGALLSGCQMVSSEEPVGEHPAQLDSDDWDGIWLHEEAAITLLVLDADRGTLEAAWVEEKAGRLVMEAVQAEVRGAGEWLFINTRLEPGEEDASPRFGFARVVIEDDRMLFWTPDLAGFRKAVESKRLPGTAGEDQVHLGKLTGPQLAEIIRGGPELFDWQNPTILIRYKD
ncbi:MAG: hypothetical protein R3200_13930 [Xanthomonadales bacterium]|nr:hypothetical protein [Xanthomonadales bacterium]